MSTETGDVKVIDHLCSWGKPSVLTYTRQTLNMVMMQVFAMVKRPPDHSFLRITSRAVQVIFGSPSRKCLDKESHLYWPTKALRLSDDECLSLRSNKGVLSPNQRQRTVKF